MAVGGGGDNETLRLGEEERGHSCPLFWVLRS
jgi:hypothetical protein